MALIVYYMYVESIVVYSNVGKVMKRKAVVLDSKDSVAAAFTDLEAGDVLGGEVDEDAVSVTLVDSIPFGYKLSLTDINADSAINKHGEIIGKANIDIRPWQRVHVRNVTTARGHGDVAR
jgi:hypothetical protein